LSKEEKQKREELAKKLIVTIPKGIKLKHERAVPSLTEILAKLDWQAILRKAIESRPTSWGDNPVREWRNAGDTVYCALMAELKRRGVR
jgi:predicted metal-dependent peptidase